MEESTKRKIHQGEITIAIVLLLVATISLFPNPGITGFVSVESKKQRIDLEIANSQSYILTTNSEEPFYLTALRISGEVIGEGIVNIYIDNNQGQRVLIYSNVMEKEQGLDTITGMDKITGNVVGTNVEEDYLVIEHLENLEVQLDSIPAEKRAVSGGFENECADSCFIDMALTKETAYQLIFYVEEGTVLKINEISYTIKKD